MEQIGLVLQGGGMRGVYTSGVLDYFMEQNLYFTYVIAVSAGACNASAYLSRQKGLAKIMHVNYINDSRYVGYRNLLFRKGIFGIDFIFDEIPRLLEPFHFEVFHASEQRFIVGVTDCSTGESVYYDKQDCDNIFAIIRASCSLPFVTSIVDYQGMKLLDGGISDPIPIERSITDGNQRNVIVLTNEGSYLRKSPHLSWLARTIYPQYKSLIASICNHYNVYNQTINRITNLIDENKVFVIRPSRFIKIKGIERNPKKLIELYDQGYEDSKHAYAKIRTWMAY